MSIICVRCFFVYFNGVSVCVLLTIYINFLHTQIEIHSPVFNVNHITFDMLLIFRYSSFHRFLRLPHFVTQPNNVWCAWVLCIFCTTIIVVVVVAIIIIFTPIFSPKQKDFMTNVDRKRLWWTVYRFINLHIHIPSKCERARDSVGSIRTENNKWIHGYTVNLLPSTLSLSSQN